MKYYIFNHRLATWLKDVLENILYKLGNILILKQIELMWNTYCLFYYYIYACKYYKICVTIFFETRSN